MHHNPIEQRRVDRVSEDILIRKLRMYTEVSRGDEELIGNLQLRQINIGPRRDFVVEGELLPHSFIVQSG